MGTVKYCDWLVGWDAFGFERGVWCLSMRQLAVTTRQVILTAPRVYGATHGPRSDAVCPRIEEGTIFSHGDKIIHYDKSRVYENISDLGTINPPKQAYILLKLDLLVQQHKSLYSSRNFPRPSGPQCVQSVSQAGIS